MITIYIITVFGSFILANLAERGTVYYYGGKNRQQNIMLWLLIIFFIIILGFRYQNYIYSDEWVYRNASVGENITWSDIFCPEGLNTVITWFSENIASSWGGAFEYGQFYILVTSIIIVILFVKAMWEYSEDFTFSVFLFVSMWFAFTSTNIIRQFVAAAILFYGMRFMKSAKFGKYLLCVILAFGFHSSAIIMLPLYFLLRIKKLDNWGWGMILIAFFLLGRVNVIGNFLFAESKYGMYFDEFGAYSVNPLRLLSIAIPCIILIVYRKYWVEYDEGGQCDINMLILTLIITIFSTQNVYYNRISYYFTVSCLSTFPMIPYVFSKNSRRVMKCLMVLLFFVFGLYQAKITVGYHNILFENISGVLYY